MSISDGKRYVSHGNYQMSAYTRQMHLLTRPTRDWRVMQVRRYGMEHGRARTEGEGRSRRTVGGAQQKPGHASCRTRL